MSYLGRSAKLSRKTQEKVSFLATAGQTVKTGLSYVSTFVEVRVNGIILTDVTDYTATNGNSITFGIALSLDDEVTVISLKTFVLADHYSKTESDAAHYTKAASDTLVTNAVNALVDSSPAALDTLNELAAALGDDANFSTTVTNSIATKLPLAGGTMTGDTLHGDNVKAKFGTGGDLEIYHDGSNSYITEIGDGDLVLQSNGAKVGLASSSPSFEWMVEANTNGSVNLYHDSAQKLATTSIGVDISGTVTADGLVVETGTTSKITVSENTGNGVASIDFVATSSFPKTKIETDLSAASLTLSTVGNDRLKIANNGDISFYEDTGTTPSLQWLAATTGLNITGRETSRSANTYALTVDNSAQSSNLTAAGAMNVKGFYGNSLTVNGLGDVSLYDDSGNAKLFWDASAESLGIGTSTPESALHVAGAAENGQAAKGVHLGMYNSSYGMMEMVSAAGVDSWIDFKDTDDTDYSERIRGGAGNLQLHTVGSERMRIDSSGNVGIGTGLPALSMDIRKSGRTIQLGKNPITNYYGSSMYLSVDVGSTERAWNVGTRYKTTHKGDLVFEYSTNDMGREGDARALSYSERMRISSDGIVTKPYQPSFSSNKANNTSYGSYVPVPFTIRSNVGGHFNGSRFTAPVAGSYHFEGGGVTHSVTSYFYMGFKYNGSQGHSKVYGSWRHLPATAGEYDFLHTSLIVYLDVGDYIELATGYNGGSPYLEGNRSSFSGHLIG